MGFRIGTKWETSVILLCRNFWGGNYGPQMETKNETSLLKMKIAEITPHVSTNSEASDKSKYCKSNSKSRITHICDIRTNTHHFQISNLLSMTWSRSFRFLNCNETEILLEWE